MMAEIRATSVSTAGSAEAGTATLRVRAGAEALAAPGRWDFATRAEAFSGFAGLSALASVSCLSALAGFAAAGGAALPGGSVLAGAVASTGAVSFGGVGLALAAPSCGSITSGGGAAYPTVGASGGVFGLLLAYGMLFPNQRMMLLFPPIPMKARTFVILFGITELVLGFTGWQPGAAHFAHLGGMLFGWLVIRYWRGQPPFGRRGPPRGPSHLRRVK